MGRTDTIVVGAGVAGCVVARRLVDAGQSVVLVEAGPGEPRPATITGPDPLAAADDGRWQWPGLLAAVADDQTPRPYRQGFGLGGGSAINAMLLAPGDRADYERWVTEHRCAGWGPDDMAPWLDLVIDSWPSSTAPPGPVTSAFAAAAAEAGHPVGGDTSMADRLGVLNARLALVDGRRHSSYDRHLSPVVDQAGHHRGRLHLLTGSAVARVTMTGRSASGVVLDGGEELGADRVVVCGGAINSPRLLMASGLTSAVDGHRLVDHPSFAFTLALRDASPAEPATGRRLVSRVLRFPAEPESGTGDLQAFVIDRVDGDGQRLAVVVVGLMNVSSVGQVGQVGHPDSGAAVGLITGVLSTGEDRRRMRAGVRHVHRLLNSSAMADQVDEVFIDDRGTPASVLDAMGDDDLDRWLLAHPGPYAHPAGSCPMGPAPDRSAFGHQAGESRAQTTAVVSADPKDGGLVHGYRNLHVIDASVLPHLVAAGLQVTVAAVAERLVDGLVKSLAASADT